MQFRPTIFALAQPQNLCHTQRDSEIMFRTSQNVTFLKQNIDYIIKVNEKYMAQKLKFLLSPLFTKKFISKISFFFDSSKKSPLRLIKFYA